MKKIMFVLSVGFALAMQAANVNWVISNVKTPTDSTKIGSGYYVALFCAAGTGDTFGSYQNVTRESITTALGKGDTSLVAKNVFNSTINASGGASGAALTGVALTSAESGTFFAVIFDNADYTKATNFIITKDVTKTLAKGVSSGGSLAFGTQATATWTAMSADTPEPTSGLLMLFGGALLVLRRKRA